MGQLRYSMLISLDGYARDAAGKFDWATPDADLHEEINEMERDVGTYIYGTQMWETMKFWADAEATDDDAPEHVEYAEIWQSARKIVVGRTVTHTDVPRTDFWPELDLKRLGRLVKESDTDVSIGGPTIAGAALKAGLVDRVTAYVVPHVAGGGLPWLPRDWTSDLFLLDASQVNDVAVLDYGTKGSLNRLSPLLQAAADELHAALHPR